MCTGSLWMLVVSDKEWWSLENTMVLSPLYTWPELDNIQDCISGPPLHRYSFPFIPHFPANGCVFINSPFCKRPLLHFIKPPSIATENSSIKMLTHTPSNSLTSWCISSKAPHWCLDVRTLKAQISYSHIVKMMVLQTSQCVIKQLNCDVASEKLNVMAWENPTRLPGQDHTAYFALCGKGKVSYK